MQNKIITIYAGNAKLRLHCCNSVYGTLRQRVQQINDYMCRRVLEVAARRLQTGY
jgi:hypothetical protein